MLPSNKAPKQAKVPYERTKAGRALLKLKRDVDRWVEKNRASKPPADIEAAEILSCELYEAAANGVTGSRTRLLKSVNKLFLH